MWRSSKLTKKLLAGYKQWRCQMMMITVRHLLRIPNRCYPHGLIHSLGISIAFLGHTKPSIFRHVCHLFGVTCNDDLNRIGSLLCSSASCRSITSFFLELDSNTKLQFLRRSTVDAWKVIYKHSQMKRVQKPCGMASEAQNILSAGLSGESD